MSQEPPKVDPEGRYSIGAAAALIGVSRNTLRRWVDNRTARCSVSKYSGRKVFTGRQVLEAWRYN